MPSRRFPGDQRAEVGEVSLLQGSGEGRIYLHSCSRMRDRFDPHQQALQVHLQLLDRRLFEHFISSGVILGCSNATCSPLCLIMAAENQFLPRSVPTRTRTEASVMR
ncbi:MAG TPA: hypothetical protein VIX20_04470 [Ktedonobacteraceae bacterium]